MKGQGIPVNWPYKKARNPCERARHPYERGVVSLCKHEASGLLQTHDQPSASTQQLDQFSLHFLSVGLIRGVNRQ